MRIWDIDPGFLNDRSLLGEHGELHGLVAVVQGRQRGYSNHPETRRWTPYIESLMVRHDILVAEMDLRGFNHKSPISAQGQALQWPSEYLDPPHVQFTLLTEKYQDKSQGRIPIPKTIHELWAFHKYSVMARSPQRVKELGKRVAEKRISFNDLADQLVTLLRIHPEEGTLRNACDHMWGYVGKYLEDKAEWRSPGDKFRLVQNLTRRHSVDYLWHSTALGELMYWIGRIYNE